MTAPRITATLAREMIRDAIRASGGDPADEAEVARAAARGALRYSAPPDDPDDAAWYAAYREIATGGAR